MNAIAPPISSASTRSISASIVAQLVGDLRPAEDRDVRALRILEERDEHLDLALEEPAGDGRAGEQRSGSADTLACARWTAPNASST